MNRIFFGILFSFILTYGATSFVTFDTIKANKVLKSGDTASVVNGLRAGRFWGPLYGNATTATLADTSNRAKHAVLADSSIKSNHSVLADSAKKAPRQDSVRASHIADSTKKVPIQDSVRRSGSTPYADSSSKSNHSILADSSLKAKHAVLADSSIKSHIADTALHIPSIGAVDSARVSGNVNGNGKVHTDSTTTRALYVSGNVGIGIASPNARLDLGSGYGSGGEKFLIYNDNNFSALSGTKMGFYLDRFGLSNNTTLIFATASANPGSFIFGSKNTTDTTLIPRMTVLGETGHVGIGTTSPEDLLDVNGGNIRITSPGGGLSMYNTSSGNKHWDVSQTGNDVTINESGVAERMRFEAGGNVGIGATSPSEKLEVNGNVKASRFIGVADTATKVPIQDSCRVAHSVNGNGTVVSGRATLTAGIPLILFSGSTNYNELTLDMGGSIVSLNLFNGGTNKQTPFAFNVNRSPSTYNMIIDTTGYIGINTPYFSRPTEQLDVNGNVKALRFIGSADTAKFARDSFIIKNSSNGAMSILKNTGSGTNLYDGTYHSVFETSGNESDGSATFTLHPSIFQFLGGNTHWNNADMDNVNRVYANSFYGRGYGLYDSAIIAKNADTSQYSHTLIGTAYINSYGTLAQPSWELFTGGSGSTSLFFANPNNISGGGTSSYIDTTYTFHGFNYSGGKAILDDSVIAPVFKINNKTVFNGYGAGDWEMWSNFGSADPHAALIFNFIPTVGIGRVAGYFDTSTNSNLHVTGNVFSANIPSSPVAVVCSLFDGTTYRSSASGSIIKQGRVVTLCLPTLSGTLTSSTDTFIRGIPTSYTTQNVTIGYQLPVLIYNNGHSELGLFYTGDNVFKPGLQTSSQSQLTAGSGGVTSCCISWIK